MNTLKTVIQKTASATFQNSMEKAKADGLSHDQSFHRAVRENPVAIKKMHRAPLFGNTRAAFRTKLHAAFVNADDDLFPGLVKNLSEPLRKALGVSSEDSPNQIRNAMSARLSGMPSSTIAQVWAAVIAYLTGKNPTRNASVATDQAKQMFPALADAAGC
jgi:hypothetical protein